MSNKKRTAESIVVIDDDPFILELIKDILQPEGFDVILAADGASGLSLLKDTKPDLVLLDIMMPGQDGYEVLQSIREHSDVPVMMITAKLGVDSLKHAVDLGADDYIRKPFRPAELVARVRAKLRRTERGHARE
ncbi:MAG: response regulator transcription factor [Dehalococcoidales bacterium]|nr:response regulator transcription factor [Dehalococcoidales bacterium]